MPFMQNEIKQKESNVYRKHIKSHYFNYPSSCPLPNLLNPSLSARGKYYLQFGIIFLVLKYLRKNMTLYWHNTLDSDFVLRRKIQWRNYTVLYLFICLFNLLQKEFMY